MSLNCWRSSFLCLAIIYLTILLILQLVGIVNI